MVGFVVMAPTGGASSSPATAAAVRRTTPSTVAPGSASSVLLIATTLTPRSATGAACRPPACRAATWTWRAAPVHSGSVKACGSEPPPSVATSSEAEYQSPHELPSRLVRTCTSLDGSAWGDWYSASLEVATEGGGSEPQAFTEPLWTGAARYVQVAARHPVGRQAAPVALRGVRV